MCERSTSERRVEQMGALSMRRDGLSIADIADVLAVPTGQVRRGIIAAGVEQGLSAAAAGRLAGVSRARAATIAKEEGWTVDRRLRERRKKIAGLSRAGLSAQDIADRTGLSVRTIRSVRRAR
jgi:DNA-directed RNA polymerase specialized sigma24 family protein